MSTTVVGLFDSKDAAQSAVTALEQNGYDSGDIQIAAKGSNADSMTGTTESGWDRFLEAIHLRAPEEDTRYYSEGVAHGQTIVKVITDDDGADDAADLLQQYGAVNIEEGASAYHGRTTTAYGNSTIGSTGSTVAGSTIGANDQAVIPVIEEQLAVGKRAVQRGGVRIYQHVTETPVQEQVTLHEEHVSVDRRPVDRAVTADDQAFQEGTYHVTETAEEPVVSKTARVVEEVVVGKTATDRVETISDTTRRTDVEVENITPGSVRETTTV